MDSDDLEFGRRHTVVSLGCFLFLILLFVVWGVWKSEIGEEKVGHFFLVGLLDFAMFALFGVPHGPSGQGPR